LAFFYAGVVLPVVCHAMTFDEPPDAATWQSGALEDKLSFTLSGKVGFVFYPLMLYPMICLTVLLSREASNATKWIVRFGIYTGMPVAAWYCAMLVISDVIPAESLVLPRWGIVFIAVAVALPVGLWWLIRLLLWVRREVGIPWIVVVLAGLAVYPIGTLIAITKVHVTADALLWPLYVVFALFLLSLLLAPPWAFGVYLGMTVRLLWRYPRPLRFRIIQMLAAMSWLGAFLAACRWAVVRSLEEYAKLPVEKPEECYAASAAACGHRAFVGSRDVIAADGTAVRVNRQLAVLKAGELALRALMPQVHRLLRRIYDAVGPAAARCLVDPYLADLAYFLLIPAEWTSGAILTCVLGCERQRIDELFEGKQRFSGKP